MIGIELCQEAVEDAKVNAKLNGKRDNIKLFMFNMGIFVDVGQRRGTLCQ